MDNYVSSFLDFLKYQRNYSDYTILSYGEDLKKYKEYLERENLSFKTKRQSHFELPQIVQTVQKRPLW